MKAINQNEKHYCYSYSQLELQFKILLFFFQKKTIHELISPLNFLHIYNHELRPFSPIFQIFDCYNIAVLLEYRSLKTESNEEDSP